MTEPTTATRSIVVERLIPHSAERIWHVLTDAPLMAQWLMENDFEPRLGARFMFRAKPMGDWDGTVQCEVTAFEPPTRLVYSWKGGSLNNPRYGSALDSVVEWTLTPVEGGTLLRLEHAGFGPQNAAAYEAMSGGWPRVLERIEQAVT